MEYVAWLIIIFAFFRLATALVNRVAQTHLPEPDEVAGEKLSLLIPARNEEENIGYLLEDIYRQDYKNYEVWVYDDASDDRTPNIARDYVAKDTRFHYLKGEEVPAGWLGKNHACYQLSKKASGDFLLFLDADVRIGQGLPARSISYVKRHQLQLLSIFPMQEMRSPGEKMTVPLMNWILTSLLPLPLIRLSSRPSLAAANGQFMLFDNDSYQKNQWHKAVRQERVEDIAIMKKIKKSSQKGQTLLGDMSIRCRMYRNFGESVKGFARNVDAYFGNSYVLTILFGMVTTFGFIAVACGLGYAFMAGYLVVALAVKGLTAAAGKQTVILNMVLMPLQLFAFWIIVAKSLKDSLNKSHQWKGRDVS
ncbi:MAG: glycosyltransferase [Bacteroidales bacterium]|nr:glycosyltransferase [Bacteroidales bacterium]